MESFTTHSVGLGLICGGVTVFTLGIYLYSINLSSKPGIPKGRFWQFPFVGESMEFTRGSVEYFFQTRVQRYGRNFRSHLLGDPCIVVTSFDKIKFVLQSPHLFKRVYSQAVDKLIGVEMAVNFCDTKPGHLHKVLSRDTVRRFIPELDKRLRDMLDQWEKMQTINVVEEVEKFAFIADCAFNCDYILPVDAASEMRSERIRKMFLELRKGVISLPVDIPGTEFHRARQTRDKLFEEIHPFVTRRRAEKGLVQHNDLLDVFVKTGETMSDSEIVKLLIGFLFAGMQTSATFMSCLMIELLSRPELVDSLREENERLAEQRKKRSDDTITHADIFERLILTNQVIKETFRTHTVAVYITREAVQDVVHEGMLFPKGWKVFISWGPLHADPNNHTNPEAFDPSRFSDESASKPNKFLPFGMGPGYCKGQDAFRVEAVVFLHHLLANYDFKSLRKLDSNSTHGPSRRLPRDVPMGISKRRPEPKL